MNPISQTSSLPPLSLGVLGALGLVFLIACVLHFQRRGRKERDEDSSRSPDADRDTHHETR